MKFGEKLKEQRTKKSLSQEELAKLIGVRRGTITNYEGGVSYPKDRKVYGKLAEIFEVDVNYLLTEDEEFLSQAAELYGTKGVREAKAILEDTAALFAGGELSEKDQLAFLHEMQAIYLDASERAREKYTPKKYRKPKSERE